MQSNDNTQGSNNFDFIVTKLCEIILTNKDCFDEKSTESFLNKLSSSDKNMLANFTEADEKSIQPILFFVGIRLSRQLLFL